MYDHKTGNKQFAINKLGLIAQRLEKNVGYVNTELKDIKAKVNGFKKEWNLSTTSMKIKQKKFGCLKNCQWNDEC